MVDNAASSSTVQHVEHRTSPVCRFLRKCFNDWSLDFAAMLAYSFLIAILPIIIIIFGTLGLVLKGRPDDKEYFKNAIIHSFPSHNATQYGIQQIVDLAFNQLANDAGIIFVVGIIFAIFFSSRLFVAIDVSMTIIYRLPERTLLRQNLMALGTLFLLIIIVILLIAAGSVPSALLNHVSGDGARFLVFFVGIIVSLAIAFLLFEIIYWLIPNKKMTFKKTWCGALVASITLEIFIILFPLYVRQFMSNYAGQIGFAIILILFFYYFALILIIGAQINAQFFEQHQPLPKPLGTFLSQMYEEQSQRNTNESSHHKTNEQQQHSKREWVHRLCCCRKRQSVQTQSPEDSNV